MFSKVVIKWNKKNERRRGEEWERQSESFILVPRTSILLVSVADLR